MVSERELKRGAVHVDVPASPHAPTEGTHRVAVIPDGWFQLSVGGGSPYSLSLELDRGTEEQKRWRRKVAALVYWAIGPYKEQFETDNVTFVVVTNTSTRRDQLRPGHCGS
jgi:hypothetical protein